MQIVRNHINSYNIRMIINHIESNNQLIDYINNELIN